MVIFEAASKLVVLDEGESAMEMPAFWLSRTRAAGDRTFSFVMMDLR